LAFALWLANASWAQAADTPTGTPNGNDAAPASAAGPDWRGVSLGEFRVRAFHPAEAQKSTVSFSLHATAANEQSAELESLIAHRRHKVRDQIIIATRLAPLAEFDEPDLGEFRRRILLRLKRILPELPIHDILIGDFEIEVRRL
jgi:hypothetical protein